MLGNYFSLIKLSNLITYNYTVHIRLVGRQGTFVPPDICPPMDNCQGGQMSGGTLALGGHLSGGTLVQGDKCPGGTVVLGGQLSWGDTCPGGQMSGGQLSRGTLVQGDKCRGDTCPGGHLSRGTNVGGTNVTTPSHNNALTLICTLCYFQQKTQTRTKSVLVVQYKVFGSYKIYKLTGQFLTV